MYMLYFLRWTLFFPKALLDASVSCHGYLNSIIDIKLFLMILIIYLTSEWSQSKKEVPTSDFMVTVL